MRLLPAALVPIALTFASATFALGPGDKERGFREGANHHVGDDGFVEDFGRQFGPGDTETLRMHSHFTHVRRWLTDRKATKPELAARRAEILGYFDEYIAKGTTPKNEHVQWRTPVFIDDHGTICAVGYLIERTAGRPLAEKIAHEHRYNVLEDIAAAMPEVRAWVESSGFTLEELASIQPGYVPPVTWDGRDLTDDKVDGSPVELVTDAKSGTWRSAYPNGSRLAQGPFQDKKPNGTWRFYHPSGNLAARGDFVNGERDGEWTFFHDAKEPIVKAKGRYMTGTLIEEWKHYDGAGELVAIARPTSPESFHGAGYLLDVMPSAEKIRHWIHRGTVAGTKHRLDYLADGTEQIYVHDTEDIAYDAGGHRLARDAQGVWSSRDCHWNKVRRDSARFGDVSTLHGLTFDSKEACTDPKPLPEARAKHVEAMLAAIRAAKQPSEAGGWPDMGGMVAANMISFMAKPDVGVAPLPANDVRVSLR